MDQVHPRTTFYPPGHPPHPVGKFPFSLSNYGKSIVAHRSEIRSSNEGDSIGCLGLYCRRVLWRAGVSLTLPTCLTMKGRVGAGIMSAVRLSDRFRLSFGGHSLAPPHKHTTQAHLQRTNHTPTHPHPSPQPHTSTTTTTILQSTQQAEFYTPRASHPHATHPHTPCHYTHLHRDLYE